MHRLFCIFAELLSFSHGAISPESAPYEMSPHFEELSGQNCSLCESSLVVARRNNASGERVSRSIRAAPSYIAEVAADVGTLIPSNGWLRDASHCVIGEHPMLPWLALTFTAARLGFEAQNAAAFRFMRLGSRLENAAGEIIPHAVSIAGGGSSTRGSRAKKASRPRRYPRSRRRPSGSASGQKGADRPPEKARQLGLTERREGASGRPLGPSPPRPEKQRRHGSSRPAKVVVDHPGRHMRG